MSNEQYESSQSRLRDRRAILRIAVSSVAIFVIFPALWLASLSLATMWAVSWDPCSWMGAVILLPLTGYLPYVQYRAAVHAQSKAATKTAVILFGVGALALLGFVTSVAELRADSISLRWGSLLLPMLIFAVVTLGMAAVNYLWSRQLKLVTPSTENNLQKPGSRSFDMIAGSLSVLFIIVFTVHHANEILPRCGEHVSVREAPSQLPADAKDVSYCKGSRDMIAYEFTIDESGFVEWVESGIGSLESKAANIPVKTITEPLTVTRYGWLSPDRDDPELAIIEEGLYYRWTKEDRGVYAAFDRTRDRAYYYAHYH